MSRQFYETYGLDYTLEIKSLIGGSPQVINLMVIELNMFEDMYGPFMRMEVVINDSMGLLDKLPIVGDEELTFKYKNPNDEEFTQKFIVYKVSGRTGIKARAQVYTLHAISREGHKNSLEYVYKPFIEKRPDEIAKDVFDNYMKDGDKSLTAVPAENKVTMVSSGQNPLNLINQVGKEAKTPNKKMQSPYVFFETVKEFWFAPIAIFMALDTQKYEFFLSVPNEQPQLEKGKGAFPARSITSIKYLDSFDNLDVIHRGAYYNEINVIDPVLKRFKIHPMKEPDKKKFQFDYKKNWDDLLHLKKSGKKFISESGKLGKAKKAFSTHRRLLLSQIEEDNEEYAKDSNKYFETMKPVQKGDQLNAPRKRHEALAKSAHVAASLNTNVLEITTPGIPMIVTGDTIKIKIPQPTQMAGEHMKFLLLYGQEADFLVTAIRHHYVTATDTYTCVFSCSKESLGEEPTPMAFDNSPED